MTRRGRWIAVIIGIVVLAPVAACVFLRFMGFMLIANTLIANQKPSNIVAFAPAKFMAKPPYPANLKFEFVQIRPGEFDMGCSSSDSECYGDEKPQHHVRISKGFEMGKYTVTQAMWEFVMGNNHSTFKGADRPVENVQWNDVQDFLQRLNANNDGYHYRLPTEAEWEYAARAGSTSARYGDLDTVAWYDQNSGNETHPVGLKPPNAWGLYDMLGNVRGWTADWYEDNYYQHSPSTDPQGPSSGQFRVVRGGSSFYGFGRYARASCRNYSAPVARSVYHISFRCVREPTSLLLR